MLAHLTLLGMNQGSVGKIFEWMIFVHVLRCQFQQEGYIIGQYPRNLLGVVDILEKDEYPTI